MTQLVLSCEHAGNRVPAAYRHLFCGAGEVLASHRGWDPGSLSLARRFQRRFSVPLLVTSTTRLLVEPNRSLGHPRLFSEFTRGLDRDAKQAIIQRFYEPHRNRVEQSAAAIVDSGAAVFHLSLHTFTPELNGQRRQADIGLLYDPRRPCERTSCVRWQSALRRARPDLRIRRNYPYLGQADGLTTYLRRLFPPDGYAGIELEVNQRWVGDRAGWKRLCDDLAESLRGIAAFSPS